VIDGGILPWPEGLHAHVARFRQGDLVECPLIVYVDVPSLAVWDASKTGDTTSREQTPFAVEGDLLPPYAMITTQTCDIVEENRPKKPRNPWIQVVPVYQASTLPSGQHKQIANHEIGHFYPMTGLPLPDGLWVADLRIEVSVGKGWLAGREPIRLIHTDRDTDLLARRLAARRARPAVSTPVNEAVLVSLKERLTRDRNSRKEDILDHIDHCRLDVIDGTRAEAAIVQIICVTLGDPPSVVREWFAQWWQDAVLNATKLGIALERPRICRLIDLNGEEMERTTRINLDHLSPDDE
jgi:hypothetical protein